jgi:hypothetical protein
VQVVHRAWTVEVLGGEVEPQRPRVPGSQIAANSSASSVVAQDHELLVARPPVRRRMSSRHWPPAALISPPRCLFSGGEGQAVPVGAPKETTNIDASSGSVREHPPDFSIRGHGQALVGVAAPVREHQQVPIAHLGHPGSSSAK